MMKKKEVRKRGRPKGSTKLASSILSLVPGFYALGISGTGISIASIELYKLFGEEIRVRMLEFKLMNVVEVEVNDKHKKIVIEYHPLEDIEKYLDKFVKKNSKYVYEKEDYGGVITGRYILTRVYRTYHKKRDDEDEEDCCPECGRSYED